MARQLAMLGTSVCLALWTVLGGPATASDSGVVKTLLVTKADAGAEYEVAKSAPPSRGTFSIARCVGTSVPRDQVAASASGSRLRDPIAGIEIRSSAIIYRTRAGANAGSALFAVPRYPSCLAQAVKAGNRGDASVTAEPARLRNTYGSLTVAIRLSVVANAKGESEGLPPRFSDLQVFIQKGRALLSVRFLSEADHPFADASAEAILTTLNQRLLTAPV